MSNNKKPKDILKEIQTIFENINKNTGWEPKRHPNEIKIEIGDAPEYHENFGVIRKENNLVIGKWIDEVKPKFRSEDLWEFIIIRESFTHFIDNSLLYGKQTLLVAFLLNLLALSYLQMMDPDSAIETKTIPIQNRFLMPIKNDHKSSEEILSTIWSLIEVINQGTTYKMLFNTFLSFIEDVNLDDIDSDEILDDLRRYLSKDQEEIAAPIYLKKNTIEVLKNLIEFGSNASSSRIAENLEVNQSTVTRQIAKLSSKFYTKWRLEKNYAKMALHSYVLIIRYPIENGNYLSVVYEDLLKIKYFREFYEGKNEHSHFQYAVIHCPHLISEKIAKKLSNFKQQGFVHSYDLKLIKNRIFKTTIVNKPFKSSLSNFKKLLNNEILSEKIVLWDIHKHKDLIKGPIDKRDQSVLKFISFIISKSLSQFGIFGAHVDKLQDFLIENNYDLNKIPECLTFLNKIQNKAIELGLIDYRINISLTGTASSDLCLFKIYNSMNEFDDLIEKIAYFGWMIVLKTLDCIYFIILGPTYDNPITDEIKRIIKENGFKFECFSCKPKKFRYVDYNLLYDFSSNKWSL